MTEEEILKALAEDRETVQIENWIYTYMEGPVTTYSGTEGPTIYATCPEGRMCCEDEMSVEEFKKNLPWLARQKVRVL